jgi:hypothetical protein
MLEPIAPDETLGSLDHFPQLIGIGKMWRHRHG